MMRTAKTEDAKEGTTRMKGAADLAGAMAGYDEMVPKLIARRKETESGL